MRPPASPEVDELRDWLAANGVDEYLPTGVTLTITPTRLLYTSFYWLGPRGWDAGHIAITRHGAPTKQRSVPLIAPPTMRVVELCSRLSVPLYMSLGDPLPPSLLRWFWGPDAGQPV